MQKVKKLRNDVALFGSSSIVKGPEVRLYIPGARIARLERGKQEIPAYYREALHELQQKRNRTAMSLPQKQETRDTLSGAVREASQENSTETHFVHSKRNTHLIALLNSFAEGDPEQQRRELAELEAGVEAARPGQRRVFGEGVNL